MSNGKACKPINVYITCLLIFNMSPTVMRKHNSEVTDFQIISFSLFKANHKNVVEKTHEYMMQYLDLLYPDINLTSHEHWITEPDHSLTFKIQGCQPL